MMTKKVIVLVLKGLSKIAPGEWNDKHTTRMILDIPKVIQPKRRNDLRMGAFDRYRKI